MKHHCIARLRLLVGVCVSAAWLLACNGSGGDGARDPSQVVAKRVVGPIDPEHAVLGAPQVIAATNDGGVVVAERQAVNIFDSSGGWQRLLGRSGSGPGEYLMPNDLRVSPNGNLLLADAGRSVVTEFAINGTPLISANLVIEGAKPNLVAALDGGFYAQAVDHSIDRGAMWPTRDQLLFVHYDAAGSPVDTIRAPGEWTGHGVMREFDAGHHWTVLPDGRTVRFDPESFEFTVYDRANAASAPASWSAASRVRVLPGEVAERRLEQDKLKEMSGGVMPWEVEIPAVKASYEGFDVSPDGRIWIRPYQTATESAEEWPLFPGAPAAMGMRHFVEPMVLVSICPDGSGRAAIEFPGVVGPVVFSTAGNRVWLLRQVPSGEIEITGWDVPELVACGS